MITHAWRVISLQGHQALLCLICGFYSYHPRDIEERYCGHCRRFLADVPREYEPVVYEQQAALPRTGPAGLTHRPEERIYTGLFADVPMPRMEYHEEGESAPEEEDT